MSETRLSLDGWPAAVADTDGRQLIVAGPGTGKTDFLVDRVGHILDTGLARPDEVVVLSFSRKATARLRSRIEERTGATGVPVDVTTYHSLAIRLLEAVTGGERPIPLTTPEQVALMRSILAEENPDDWPPPYRAILSTQAFSSEVADFLLRCSERLLTPDQLVERARERRDWVGLPGLYARYLRRLDEIERTDYGILLMRVVELLRAGDHDGLTAQFRYVVVDEYQDTSPAQAEIVELLATRHGNLTVAGDPYQSIFSFRGAEVRNIAAFMDRAPTRRVVLEQSLRVPAPILEAALRVVSGGDLPGSAGPVVPAPHQGSAEAYVFDQETAEAEWIAREVEHLVRVEGLSPSDVAVVVRSKRGLLAELSRALHRRAIPHDPPDSRLVDHPAVRLVQDLVTTAIHGGAQENVPALLAGDADRSIRRILLGPLYGISVGAERDMARDRRRSGDSWPDVVGRHMPEAEGLIGLLSDSRWATDIGAADGFWEVWSRLDGIERVVTDPDREEWRRAWTALGQMVGRQAERDPGVSLSRFFEMVEEDDFEATPLISHQLNTSRVTLTTLHQAKGLEFEVVFIANAVEGVFPDLRRSRRMLRPELLSPERTVDPEAQHLFQIQEEMRLAYTAMTRARRRVVWTATDAGVDQGEHRPSRFLLAVAGDITPGPPNEMDRLPLTINEAEASLRHDLLDPAPPTASRLAAARILGRPDRPWWDPATFAGAVSPGPDRPVMKGKFRLSPSQATSYETCPRRYVLERRLRLGDSSSTYTRFGDLCHRILEVSEDEVIGTGERHATLERVLEVTEDVWKEADFGSPHLNDAWKAKAVEMFTKLYSNWPGRGEPIAVELGIEKEIDGVSWMGRVDRLERSPEGLRVVDYKTGGKAMSIDESAESMQLAFYALAVATSHGDVIASEMWYPRVKSKSVTTRSVDIHQLDRVEERMRSVTADITAEEWAPKVGANCQNCAFLRSCPAWPEGRGAYLT